MHRNVGDLMRLEKVVRKQKPDYPSFNDHRLKRRSALKLMFGGLIAAFAAGCKFLTPRTSGAMAVPDHPDRPQIKGDIVAPTPPRIKGKMVPVKPPQK